jgi:hypothetical protein
MSEDTITVCEVTMLRLRTRRNPGAIVYRLATISGVNRVGNGDGLGVLVLYVMLFSVNFLVLLEVLGSLESLFTYLRIR